MIAWSSALLVGLAAGCRDAPGDDTEGEGDGAEAGFVLVGGDALAARPVLDGVAVTALPIAGPDGAARRLDSATWSIAIDAPAGVLVHAHAADGGFDTLVIGGDIHADRIAVRASAERVEALAHALDAEGRAMMDGRWLLAAEDIWPRAAAVDATFAPDEIQPVVIRDEGLETERAGGAAPASAGSAPAAPATLAGRATGVPSVILGEVRCEDPVAGVWVATTYRTDREDWSQMTLTLGREDGTVRGTIDSVGWAGDPSDPTVPSDAVLKDEGWKVRMSARGTIAADGAFALDGIAITQRRVAERFAWGPYQRDHFTGRLVDGALRVVNNDGAYAFDRPYTFERTACR